MSLPPGMNSLMPQNLKPAEHVSAILHDYWPHYPHTYFGASGTTLIYRALQAHPGSVVVAPAFFCPKISLAVALAGKRIVHVDADRRTLLPDYAGMKRVLEAQDPAETVLFVDHSFGYPFPHLARLRQEFPALLIIEDCARALGVRVDNELPGHHADWLLLSMYKTVPGSAHGSVLLSRTQLPIGVEQPLRPSMRERLANVKALRSTYEWLQRFRAGAVTASESEPLDQPAWTPLTGGPNSLCCKRFAAALTGWDSSIERRHEVASRISKALDAEGYECVLPSRNAQWPAQFVSFAARTKQEREELILSLSRSGVPVGLSWHIVPAHFRGFSGTFPLGASNSICLADQMIHLRLSAFLRPSREAALMRVLQSYTRPSLPAVTAAAS